VADELCGGVRAVDGRNHAVLLRAHRDRTRVLAEWLDLAFERSVSQHVWTPERRFRQKRTALVLFACPRAGDPRSERSLPIRVLGVEVLAVFGRWWGQRWRVEVDFCRGARVAPEQARGHVPASGLRVRSVALRRVPAAPGLRVRPVALREVPAVGRHAKRSGWACAFSQKKSAR
jgi:hypothetical protein